LSIHPGKDKQKTEKWMPLWYFTPVIPAIQEAYVGGLKPGGHAEQKALSYLKILKKKMGCGLSGIVPA
jgi:hypothetical protein